MSNDIYNKRHLISTKKGKRGERERREKMAQRYEGCAHFRQRLVCATLSGKKVIITKIRENSTEPGSYKLTPVVTILGLNIRTSSRLQIHERNTVNFFFLLFSPIIHSLFSFHIDPISAPSPTLYSHPRPPRFRSFLPQITGKDHERLPHRDRTDRDGRHVHSWHTHRCVREEREITEERGEREEKWLFVKEDRFK